MRDIGMCNLPSEPASVTAEFKLSKIKLSLEIHLEYCHKCVKNTQDYNL